MHSNSIAENMRLSEPTTIAAIMYVKHITLYLFHAKQSYGIAKGSRKNTYRQARLDLVLLLIQVGQVDQALLYAHLELYL